MSETILTGSTALIAEITSLRAQLDEARADHRTAIDHLLVRTHLVNRKTEEIDRLQAALDEARRKAIEECAAIAEQDRDFCDYDTASEIAKSIRALISESKS